MPLTSGRPLKFKCVGATCIGETGHVREESLPPGVYSFPRLGFGTASPGGRLRVVKRAEKYVARRHQSRSERERRMSTRVERTSARRSLKEAYFE